MAGWFPTGENGNGDGWRLDIVSLLAVIGESAMESHSQAVTSAWTCILPRLIPAPQTLLKPTRPTRMPQVNAAVVGVHNGTFVPTLNYFPNIIHPLDELPPYGFKVLKITHNTKKDPVVTVDEKDLVNRAGSTPDRLETGAAIARPIRRQTTLQKVVSGLIGKDGRPRIPSRTWSPLNILAFLSFLETLGLIVWATLIHDGTAVTAVVTITLASSIVGYASWWEPLLQKRFKEYRVPDGDVVLRTREGAFLVVKCNENVARELYIGTEECKYYVQNLTLYRFLVGTGTFMLMISVVLLGNCGFAMQAAIGLSYIVLNGLYWAASIFPKALLWDLSLYVCEDITPEDAKNADVEQREKGTEGRPGFTRTLWYAIRETKKIGWVKRMGAAPNTDRWDEWLKEAEENAVSQNRTWSAVQQLENVVGQPDFTQRDPTSPIDIAEQYAPAIDVPPQATR